jgi:23S rRNA (cytidine2498-2'-O)-methyltransferase
MDRVDEKVSVRVESARFVMITCQVGAESAVKGEVARHWPDFRFSYSRPGFLTFKLPENAELPDDFKLRSVFARAHAFSLGKAIGTDADDMAQQAWRIVGDRAVTRIHAWPRDEAAPGRHGFEPTITPAAVEAKEAIRRACPHPDALSPQDADPLSAARRGESVLDCVIVKPGEWWIGHHRARSAASRWPGGIIPLELPPDAVSRAWLKMEEGLRWSRLPIPSGARVAEIGSAPGGASQSLLARGFHVTGIDPAEMAPVVLEHPNFTPIRHRAIQVRRREFRKIRWLTADMNVAPNYTLDVIEGIVTHPEVRIRGLLLTLKLIKWDLAEHVPDYLARIRDWGYQLVRARQLRYNHQEVCVAALRRASRGTRSHRRATREA